MQIDSIHFYVTDAARTGNWFITYLDFQLVDRYQDGHNLTIVVAKNTVLLVISSPLNKNGVVANYLANHAEGIIDLTFRIESLDLVINRASKNGIKILQSPQIQDNFSYACVAGWDCLQHTLIKTNDRNKAYLLPNGKLRKLRWKPQKQSVLKFREIDHIVLNVAQGKLTDAVSYYQKLFGFKIQQTFKIKTQQSGLHSQALIDNQGHIQFNINEPTTKNSQIQEFIDFNGGAGIQHLALKTNNLIQDVAQMRSRGVPFLPVSPVYYTQLKNRLQQDLIDLNFRELQALTQQKILIDWQKNNFQSLLMQVFTKPILAQPTFFLEFIERRKQAVGFGEGNFQALFAAVEQEQMRKWHN